MNLRRVSLSCVCIAFLLATASGAQNQLSNYRIDGRLVEVYATVVDERGHFVDGLTAEAFRVLDNGKEQRLKHFESESQSMHCAILLDTTGSMTGALPRLKNSVIDFISDLGPEDYVAIYTFTEQLQIEQDFTQDKDAAKRAVLRVRAGGRTALFNALAEAAQAMRDQSGKKAMVVFTDGNDNASILNSDAAVNRARIGGVPLFTVAEGEAMDDPDLKKLLLNLSTSTGGAAFDVNDEKKMDAVFLRISGQLRHMYMLAYTPAIEPGEKDWRRIEVQVDRVQDARVQAKTGYFP
jgi:Ca-activated chloride channel family protein